MNGEFPVTFIKKPKPPAFTGTLAGLPKFNLTNDGWKVAHIIDVGLGTKGPASANTLISLQRHTFNLMRPRNMFLVPKHVDFGELPQVIEVFRAAQSVKDYLEQKSTLLRPTTFASDPPLKGVHSAT